MKKIKVKYYHTGENSLDNPEIKAFIENEQDMDYGFGPFNTFESAKIDLLAMIKYDIRNLKDLESLVKKLKIK